MVQLSNASSEQLVYDMVPPPAKPLSVPPAQVKDGDPGAMMTGPGTVGRTSVKSRAVTGLADPLVMVKVMVEVPPGPIVVYEKTLLFVGCAIAGAANPKAKTHTDKRRQSSPMARIQS